MNHIMYFQNNFNHTSRDRRERELKYREPCRERYRGNRKPYF